jgi:hypothetical protein
MKYLTAKELAEIVERARGYWSNGALHAEALSRELRKAAEEKPAQCRCTLPKFKPWIHVDCKPAAAPQPERPSADDWAWLSGSGGTRLMVGTSDRINAQAARLASGEDIVIPIEKWRSTLNDSLAAERERDAARDEAARGRVALSEAHDLLADFLKRTTPSAGEGA